MASSSRTEKKTKGRQKIEMKVIENEDDRLITFSKRRSGIYKKISELSTMCGTEILFISWSPAGKPFSFGHPSIESVANRFFNRNVPVVDNANALVEAHRMVRINELNQNVNEVNNLLDTEKERQKILAKKTGEKTSGYWWEIPADQLNLQELEELHSKHAEFLNQLYITMNNKMAGSSSMHHAQFNPLGGSSSMPSPRDSTRFDPFVGSSPMPAPRYPGQFDPFAGSSSMPAPRDPPQFDPFAGSSSMPVPRDYVRSDPFAGSYVPVPRDHARFHPNVGSSSMHATRDPTRFDPFAGSSPMPAPRNPPAQFDPFIVYPSMHAPMDTAEFNPFTDDPPMHVPMDATQVDPSTTNVIEDDPGYGHGPQQF